MRIAILVFVAIICGTPAFGGSPTELAAAQPSAETMLGCDLWGTIYDVDRTTGAATNPRDTHIIALAGIVESNSGVLYGLTTGGGTPHPNSLYRIDKATGNWSLVGVTGVWVIEGDLAFDPSTGKLYGLFEETQIPTFGQYLLEIDPTTGSAARIGAFADIGDFSAMAFHSDGRMFVLDAENSELLEIDPATASVLRSVGLSAWLNRTAGMAFDPISETFFFEHGNNKGNSRLYTLDSDTGILTTVGLLGVPDGMTGLSIRNTVLFRDDFESGNASAWSGNSP